MKRIILAAIVLGFALTMFAADTGKVIMATTDDGRKVVLLPDGTWKWVDMGSSVSTPKASTDEDLQKITGYFVQKGYIIKTSDAISRTLQTDLYNTELEMVTAKGPSGKKAIMKALEGPIKWTVRCTLTKKGPELWFQYFVKTNHPRGGLEKLKVVRTPDEYVPTTLEELCGLPAVDIPTFLPASAMAYSCNTLKANEKAIRMDIDALIKPASAPVQKNNNGQK